MYLVNNNNVNDPGINLALEEYCLHHLQDGRDYLLLYINAPAVIVGRNQNPMAETNYAYLQKKSIRLVRRISGGGAVYHDLGNLNLSLISAHDRARFHNYEKLTEPVITTLQQAGIPAALKNNNIVVDGRKVSGAAQFTNMHAMISHATLLWDAELDVLGRALQSNIEVTASRAVKSVRSNVANACEFLSRPMELALFRKNLLKSCSETYGGLREYRLSGQAWDQVYALAANKYGSWEWNFAKTPDFTARHQIKYGSEIRILRLKVKRGMVAEIETVREGSIEAAIRSQVDRFIGKPYNRLAAELCLSLS